MEEQGVGFIGSSSQTEQLLKLAKKVASLDAPVLITGEAGTGKDLIAKIIHRNSIRSNHPFVVVNVAALTPAVFKSELFGHEKGAFTGANQSRAGIIRNADQGTLCLDEIDSATFEIQAAISSFIETGEIRPLGSDNIVRVDVRLITLTNADPVRLAADGKLRQDLLTKLSTIRIHVPPLRERKDDIPILSTYFIDQCKDRFKKPNLKISQDAISLLLDYHFPGNVRELQNIIYSASLLSEDEIITQDNLKSRLLKPKTPDDQISVAEVRALKQEIEYLKKTTIPATPIWEGRHFPSESDYCFVLMPFSDQKDLQPVYIEHVKKVIVERFGLRCERADDIHDISGVMQSVWECISKARLIIAEMTGRNPNVFYELGIAHTLGKPVIMITQSMDDVPFDLKHLRCIVYEYKPGKIDKFEDALFRTIQKVLSMSNNLIRQDFQN